MKVKRIVADLSKSENDDVRHFYKDLLGLDLLMDFGWIQTYGTSTRMSVQVSVASAGGSGAPAPDLSIEVDDLDEALEKARSFGVPIEYGPTHEPWGVRRFFVRDPAGNLINILQHDNSAP